MITDNCIVAKIEFKLNYKDCSLSITLNQYHYFLHCFSYFCFMNFSSKLIQDAVEQFAKLPGIGRKSAMRLALHLLKMDKDEVRDFGEAFIDLRSKISYCKSCHNISDIELCELCSNPNREDSILCVVEDIRDVMAIENTHQFKGKYHVLGGIISPMDGVGPSDLTIEPLIRRLSDTNTDAGIDISEGRVSENATEIIFALPATMEGDTTSFFLYKKMVSFDIKITTLARGVAVGEALQHADEATLARSMDNRTLYEG